MPRQVLVAVDFSEASERALGVAREYAVAFGARLHLLHVVPPTTDPAPQPRLEALAAGLGGAVPVITAVASGLPAAQIVRYAARNGIDLIVLGTHGRTGFSRALLGSVAEAVVRTAPCPVLTVPAQAPAPPPEAPSPAAPRRCLVCARPTEDDLICAACRALIRGEALERKHGEERAGRG